MNLGFVDEKDTEEIEAKARTTGKEPDKPFDEQGRDVFADYSFDGAWAGPDSEDEDFEVEQEDAGATSDDEDDALEEDEEKESTEAEQEDACLPHTSSSAGHEPSGSNTSAAYVEGSQPIINKFASPVKAGQASQEDDTTPEDYPRRDPLSVVVEEPKEEDRAAPSVAVGDSLDGAGPTSHIRNSVEMPRLESPGATTGDEKAPRVSVDPEDWDVVEAMASDEVADNGRKGPRRRLMAGTNLFAKGVVDKYKLQLKPLSRVPTPTRSYTSKSPLDRQASASVQPPRSAKTSNQLSPSPSIGGMSESPSSAESNEPSIRPEKNTSRGPGRRLVTPRLLRASSDWMSSSLPSSPTPRLKLRRNKKGTAPESMTPPSEENQLQPPVEPGFVPATPKSVDSAATLPIENAGGFGLQPLTRVRSRDRGSPQSQRSQNYSHSASEGRLANETPK